MDEKKILSVKIMNTVMATIHNHITSIRTHTQQTHTNTKTHKNTPHTIAAIRTHDCLQISKCNHAPAAAAAALIEMFALFL